MQQGCGRSEGNGREGDWSVAGDREARREVKAKPGHLTALFAWLLILRPIILSNSAATANGQQVSGQRSRRDGHGREAWPTCGCGGAAILSGPNLACRRLHSGRAVKLPSDPHNASRTTLAHTTACPHCALPAVHPRSTTPNFPPVINHLFADANIILEALVTAPAC